MTYTRFFIFSVTCLLCVKTVAKEPTQGARNTTEIGFYLVDDSNNTEGSLYLHAFPSEILTHYFRHNINQGRFSSFTLDKLFYGRMPENWLWYQYAQKAHIIRVEEYSQSIDYKEIVKDHNTFSFTDLGVLTENVPHEVSALNYDGTAVVGTIKENGDFGQHRAFYWTRNKGIEMLEIPRFYDSTDAYGISVDGNFIVGTASSHNKEEFNYQAIVWNAEGKARFIEKLNDGDDSSAYGVSANGQFIVGYAADGNQNNSHRAFIYSRDKGIRTLGRLNGAKRGASAAMSISSGGHVIAGNTPDGLNRCWDHAAVWNREGKVFPLGRLHKGLTSYALNTSVNGKFVVGFATAKVGAKEYAELAFLWSAGKGMQSLGVLQGGISSQATAVSFDGNVVAGRDTFSVLANTTRAFIWTPQGKMQSIEKLLRQHKVLPKGWFLKSVKAVTPSGSVMIGTGLYKGVERSWRAVIPRGNLF